ncbi:unnamed protein product [Polarella glacialis]|uniref:Uncharacterized protein n=1 Tax=Polarella glacialis TaxID=89957 RepID=A0A813KYX3_POLGL|nr:unnamed protein product [Polarella glacialis]
MESVVEACLVVILKRLAIKAKRQEDSDVVVVVVIVIVVVVAVVVTGWLSALGIVCSLFSPRVGNWASKPTGSKVCVTSPGQELLCPQADSDVLLQDCNNLCSMDSNDNTCDT